MALVDRHCAPCTRDTPALDDEHARQLLAEVPDWQIRDGRLQRGFTFANFREAMRFVNRLAEVAESEGHHPDFSVFAWKHVEVSIWTHAIRALSENDFVLAAKLDAIVRELRADHAR